VWRANTMIVFDLLIIVGFLVAIGSCINLANPDDAQAEAPKKKQLQHAPRKNPSCNPEAPLKTAPNTKKPAPSPQHPAPSTHRPTKTAATAAVSVHGTFVASLTNAPFPYTGKDADPHFFDFTDPQTGERFRTARTLERLSEKDHYRDSSVLFYLPTRFNPNKPFLFVVFFHGNRSDVRQSSKDYRLEEQIESSGRNVVLLLPQLARNASDSNPGKFARKNGFRAFMQEAAQVLSQKVGKKYRRSLEQAPIILAAFSGGYKPLACAIDRGGVDSRIKGVLLLDALYEDLYIFGKWLLSHADEGVFVNIFTQGSACEEKTGILAQFLREHRVPFKEEWPKRGFPKKPIFLIGSSFDHLQIPLEGPPHEPIAALLRSLKI
jgi:hypothetical protein